jgi:putative nucleotidyltransferase with HDIG domain
LLPIRWAVKATERALVGFQLAVLGASVAGAALLSTRADWRPIGLFFLLLTLAVLSEPFRLDTKSFYVTTSFLALVLAMALLGPTPASVIGVVIMLIGAIRRRAALQPTLANVSTYAFFPLVGGTLFKLLDGKALLDGDGFGFVFLVLFVFLITNAVNFLLIALDVAVIDRQPIWRSLRFVYAPTLPVELAVGLLTAGVAYVYQQEDFGALALLVAVMLIFQYLLRTALNSLERKDQLEGRTRQLASLQVGLLSTVMQTLSLRDKMTARHSAAVARYSREIARELGLNEREQEVVHTAALLHDIGKFIFPDSILFADSKLSDEDFEIIERHPEQGARLVARIEGYGPVAEIILAHHERIDGGGYPNGLVADQIPLAARIISVADTYDVMTSRDSYRRPVPSQDAIAELRRVSGAQLDGRVVETFIRLLEQRSVTFRHADDADFEQELNFERRVADYAAPRPLAA